MRENNREGKALICLDIPKDVLEYVKEYLYMVNQHKPEGETDMTIEDVLEIMLHKHVKEFIHSMKGQDNNG